LLDRGERREDGTHQLEALLVERAPRDAVVEQRVEHFR
jgi:hypothetical protein